MANNGMLNYIYTLSDHQGVFYCGRTGNLQRRMQQHLRDKTMSQKAIHIRALVEAGVEISMHVMETVEGKITTEERDWINEFHIRGIQLLNGNQGDNSALTQEQIEYSKARAAAQWKVSKTKFYERQRKRNKTQAQLKAILEDRVNSALAQEQGTTH